MVLDIAIPLIRHIKRDDLKLIDLMSGSLPGAGAGAGAGVDAGAGADIRSAKGSTTAGRPLGVHPSRERLAIGSFASGSTSSNPAAGEVVEAAGVVVGGAGPSNAKRSNMSISAPPAEDFATEILKN